MTWADLSPSRQASLGCAEGSVQRAGLPSSPETLACPAQGFCLHGTGPELYGLSLSIPVSEVTALHLSFTPRTRGQSTERAVGAGLGSILYTWDGDECDSSFAVPLRAHSPADHGLNA